MARVLGTGGMSTVFAAVHRNGKRVAVKVLHPELAADGRLKMRFLREGYIANRVEHPGAVSVLDDDTAEDGTTFLVMELLEGETVSERQARTKAKLPLPQALAIAHRTLDVLRAAHRLRIVHRDVKPGNIFLTSDRSLKLLDFGIARVRELPELGAVATRTGATLGTPAFMAPEQARGRLDEIDARTDLYALAATLFLLVTGRQVHERVTPNELMIATATVPAPSLATVMPDSPPGLAELIDRGLRIDRDERWPDALSMQQAVERVWRELELAGSPADHQLPEVEVGSGVSSDTSETAPGSVASVASLAAASNGKTRGFRNWRTISVVGVVAGAAALAVLVGKNREGSPAKAEPPHGVATPGAGQMPALVPRTVPATQTAEAAQPPSSSPPRSVASSSKAASGSPKPGFAKARVRRDAPPPAASSAPAPSHAPPGDFLDRRD